MRYFDFRWLLKADDDTFVCLGRIASMLHDLPPEVSDKVYAGVPTACDQRTNTDFWVRSIGPRSHLGNCLSPRAGNFCEWSVMSLKWESLKAPLHEDGKRNYFCTFSS